MILRFDGPYQNASVFGVGLVDQGQTFEVSDERGLELLGKKRNRFTEIKPPAESTPPVKSKTKKRR